MLGQVRPSEVRLHKLFQGTSLIISWKFQVNIFIFHCVMRICCIWVAGHVHVRFLLGESWLDQMRLGLVNYLKSLPWSYSESSRSIYLFFWNFCFKLIYTAWKKFVDRWLTGLFLLRIKISQGRSIESTLSLRMSLHGDIEHNAFI